MHAYYMYVCTVLCCIFINVQISEELADHSGNCAAIHPGIGEHSPADITCSMYPLSLSPIFTFFAAFNLVAGWY